MVISLAKYFPNYEFLLVGSTYGCEKLNELEKIKNVTLVGEVEYSRLTEYLYSFNVAIMPFKINKLITAVDPVKLYEYIALGKSILTVEYKELLKFKEFVNFYSDYNTFKFILETCMQNSNNTKANDDFIRNNSWHSRVKEVIQLMNSI
jgi:hypothetical protein